MKVIRDYGPPIVAAILTWLIRGYAPSTMWSHAWSFFYSFLPLWIALIVYAVVWLVRDYRKLRRWVGTEAIQHNDTIRLWVRSQPEHSWPYIHKRSLDDRISTWLEWWGETQMEHRVRLLLMKVKAEEVRK